MEKSIPLVTIVLRRKNLAGFSPPSLGWHSMWWEFKKTVSLVTFVLRRT